MDNDDFTTHNSEIEEWRDLPGYEVPYQVSSLGRVRRTSKLQTSPANHVLSPSITAGYLRLSLYQGEKRVNRTVHSLVALCFLGERPEGAQINHLDGDRLNNTPSNLEYCTASENVKHSFDVLGKEPHRPRGETSGVAKLTEADVRAIRQLKATTKTSELAARYGVTTETIRKIVRRALWSWLE